MSGRGQTLVKGHTLVGEGVAFESNGQWMVNRWGGLGGEGHAKCSCGALSPSLLSGGARKRWHREHKAEVSREAVAGRGVGDG